MEVYSIRSQNSRSRLKLSWRNLMYSVTSKMKQDLIFIIKKRTDVANDITEKIGLIFLHFVEICVTFIFNGFDNQKSNLIFAKTDFQVLNLILHACNMKQKYIYTRFLSSS